MNRSEGVLETADPLPAFPSHPRMPGFYAVRDLALERQAVLDDFFQQIDHRIAETLVLLSDGVEQGTRHAWAYVNRPIRKSIS